MQDAADDSSGRSCVVSVLRLFRFAHAAACTNLMIHTEHTAKIANYLLIDGCGEFLCDAERFNFADNS